MQEHIGKELSFDNIQEKSEPKGDYAGCSVIFLDVDGVLNCMATKDRIVGFAGLDDEKILILKKMADFLDAYIILSSSWKSRWSKDDKSQQDIFGNTLDMRLANYGLVIMDRTYDNGWERGRGIVNWLEEHGPVRRFVILDDEEFDFEVMNLSGHWIRSTFYDPLGGIGENHLEYLKQNIERFSCP